MFPLSPKLHHTLFLIAVIGGALGVAGLFFIHSKLGAVAGVPAAFAAFVLFVDWRMKAK
jgi:hypothetical protein